MTTTTVAYKAGDYLTKDDWVILEVVAVLTDGSVPVYGLWHPDSHGYRWYTSYELETMGLYKIEPDFAKWETLAVGDMIHCGVKEDREYCQVLARIDQAVLLSMTPPTRAERDTLRDLSTQLEELTKGAVSQRTIDQMMHLPKDARAAYQTASHKWWTIKELAWQHWKLIKEE